MEIVLGLGGNIGDRFENLVRALNELVSGGAGLDSGAEAVFLSQSLGGQQVAVSPLYESDALLPEGAPDSWNQDFYNLAVRGSTRHTLPELLDAVKRIEERLGRGAHEVWSPRTIDIDILAVKAEGFSWGRSVNSTIEFQDERLTVPHPGLTERPFALWPLADLAPHWVIGQGGRGGSALQLAQRLGRRFAAVRESAVSYEKGSDNAASCGAARAPLHIQERLRRCVSAMGARFEDGSSLGTTVVGILNVTPDSFSDGATGEAALLDSQLSRALEMVSQGASVLDLGGESTRPGAKEVEPLDEWRRIEPLLTELKRVFNGRELATGSSPQISVDTRHHQVAARALEAGADWINDVTGLRSAEMQRVVRDGRWKPDGGLGVGTGASRFVFMHSLSVPPRPTEVMPATEQIVGSLITWAEQRLTQLQEEGLNLEHAIFDPGIGFGKTPEQSWQMVQQIERFSDLPVPTLLGHSRKSFLSKVSDSPPAERDVETALISAYAAEAGVAYIRVHNVKATAQAIKALAYLKY